MPDFYPRQDGALLHWSVNFGAQIAATPGDFGLSAQDAADFAALQQAYAMWYAKTKSSTARTAVSVRMKNQTRAAMMAKGRELAGLVRARSATTNQQLSALGLRVRRKARRAVPVPGVAPRVRMKKAYGSLPVVKLADGLSGRARKPAGAVMAVVLYAVGEAAPVSERQWRFGLTTGDPVFRWKLPRDEQGQPLRAGQRVWLIACWVNERGERGPWSQPLDWRVDYSHVVREGGVSRRAA